MLASASPARRRLLQQALIPHQVMVSGVDESNFQHNDPSHLVLLLAQAKATAVLNQLADKRSADLFKDEIKAVLGCDSVFEFEGEIFGKPLDATVALKRWRRMSGRSGVLHTGHALLSACQSADTALEVALDGLLTQTVSTRVYFAQLSQSEIEAYVATGEPLRCAGGFALEGQGGMAVSRLEGCYSNVIGLSLPWLREVLPGCWDLSSSKNPRRNGEG